MSGWRTLRHSLADETVAMVQHEQALGNHVAVHLMLVSVEDEQRSTVACKDPTTLGQLITGDSAQVTCAGCLETVHA